MNDLHARPLILDFGMHLGEDSEFYLALGARVIAFEANETLVQTNRTHFHKELESGQLQIVEGAITSPAFQGDSITFYVDRSKSVWGTTRDEWVRRNATLGTSVDRIVVPAVNLADILLQNDIPYYVKIDIEGADRDVLDTLLALNVCPDFLSIESSKTSLDDIAAEIELLGEIGYTRFAAVQQGIIPGSTYQGKTLYGAQALRYQFREHSSGCFGTMLQKEFKSAGAILDDYKKIFRRYELFGDTSWLMRSPSTRFSTRVVNKVLSKVAKQPLCGWFDTHACH
jgi:FkbM family methyltransferase